MKKHWQYLKYVLRHKLYVYQEGRKLKLGRWQLLRHDLSKFRPDEWGPYAAWFYGGPHPDESEIGYYERTYYGLGRSRQARKAAFDEAWLKHQQRNPHHWQHWILRNDNGPTVALEMPRRYMLEMVADWAGAGRAITGKLEVGEWYTRNRDNMLLHPDTRDWVETCLHLKYGMATPWPPAKPADVGT